MHVGNDVEKDIVPALNAGFDAVLIDRSAETSDFMRQVGARSIPVINSLDALPRLLNKERVEGLHAARMADREQKYSMQATESED